MPRWFLLVLPCAGSVYAQDPNIASPADRVDSRHRGPRQLQLPANMAAAAIVPDDQPEELERVLTRLKTKEVFQRLDPGQSTDSASI